MVSWKEDLDKMLAVSYLAFRDDLMKLAMIQCQIELVSDACKLQNSDAIYRL